MYPVQEENSSKFKVSSAVGKFVKTQSPQYMGKLIKNKVSSTKGEFKVPSIGWKFVKIQSPQCMGKLVKPQSRQNRGKIVKAKSRRCKGKFVKMQNPESDRGKVCKNSKYSIHGEIR